MYLLSKIGFNTAENGPSEVWGTHCRIYLLFGGRVSPNVALPRKLDARPEGNYLERKASRPPPQENKRQKKQEKGWNSRHTVVHPSCILDNGEGLLQDFDFISFFIPKNKEHQRTTFRDWNAPIARSRRVVSDTLYSIDSPFFVETADYGPFKVFGKVVGRRSPNSGQSVLGCTGRRYPHIKSNTFKHILFRDIVELIVRKQNQVVEHKQFNSILYRM